MNFFQSLKGSILPNALNKRFRELVQKINELEGRIEGLEGGLNAVTVADEETQVVATYEQVVDTEEVTRQKAKALGITSWHTKGIDRLTKEIAEKEA